MNYSQYPTYQPMQSVQPMQPAYANTYLPRTEPVYTQPTMQQGGFLKGRPVTSEEEARGIPVEFDGSVMVFPDAAHGAIYTKQLNMQDGTAVFHRYMLNDAPPVQEAPPAVQYADKQEVLELRRMFSDLQAEVDAFARKQNRKRSVLNNDESDDANSTGS